MSIKQNGGVFGRNPTFNDVTIEGQLTFDGDIDINSDLKVDGDIETTGNVIIATSGKGIDFSATAGTGTSELLDDYEEGTFTGVLKEGANTLASATGYYTKVGEICTVWWKSIFTVSNANNGLITITGLPFSASGVDASGTAIARVLGTGVTGLHSFVADSGATLSLRQDNSLAYANNVTNDDLFATNGSAGDYLWVHCTYRTA